MARLGRRGIVLSLFINALNIALYLIILTAACLNIIEASVNFIILNGSAICIASLLIISEIRLPQLTYEYFRFLCTYRGRGLTYIFFGCLVATPIPFNLYGSIVIVCMGLAFFIISFITLIPPLDGMLLNYRKLDEWREQRHFRIQLEAQRIYEQQLQQEQALAGLIPHHIHTNGLTIHGTSGGTYGLNGMGSPKHLRNTSGGGAGAGGAGKTMNSGPANIKSIFSPPLSALSTTGSGNSATSTVDSHAVPLQQVSMIPKDLDDYSEVTLEPVEDGKPSLSSRISSTVGIRLARAHMGRGTQGPLGGAGSEESSGKLNGVSTVIDKELPPIVTKATIEHPTYAVPTAFNLTTPLQDESVISKTASLEEINSATVLGNKASATVTLTPTSTPQEVSPRYPVSVDGSTLPAGGPFTTNHKTANSSNADVNTTSAVFGGSQHSSNQPPLKSQAARTIDYSLPLRTNNKPAPPYDPFRKASHLPSHPVVPSTATPALAATSTSVIASICQSIYQSPEPSVSSGTGYGRGLESTGAALSAVNQGGYHRPPPTEIASAIREPAATATVGRKEPSSRVSSGGYGMAGVTTIATKPSAAVPYPRPPNVSLKQHQPPQHHVPSMQHPPQFQAEEVEDHNDMSPMIPSQERNYRSMHDARIKSTQASRASVGMPDIVLTLPTPGEITGGSGAGANRDGYFPVG